MKVIIASDHAGFKLKEALKKFLETEKIECEDFGPKKHKKDDDYPDYIKPAAKKVARNKLMGIVIGFSGQGEAIAANKVKGVRAAVFYGGDEKIVKLSRQHNACNILSLGANFISETKAKKVVKLWLKTPYSNATRHNRRLRKLE
tara:strand:+ start:592 stop:1026 length:435 start_codon:yes stop_codon:yes gene_type:complete